MIFLGLNFIIITIGITLGIVGLLYFFVYKTKLIDNNIVKNKANGGKKLSNSDLQFLHRLKLLELFLIVYLIVMSIGYMVILYVNDSKIKHMDTIQEINLFINKKGITYHNYALCGALYKKNIPLNTIPNIINRENLNCQRAYIIGYKNEMYSKGISNNDLTKDFILDKIKEKQATE